MPATLPAGAPGRDPRATLDPSGEIRAAVSDGITALFKEFYGRGPDHAQTYVNGDLVVCLLRGGSTRVEQTLQECGHGQDVVRQRMAFQELMRDRFTRSWSRPSAAR